MEENQKRKAKANPLDGFTQKQIEELIKSNDDLDLQEARLVEEKLEEDKMKSLETAERSKPFKRLRRSPLEIINRSLFFVFLGSFLFSFISVYTVNKWWFIIYVISTFSCVLYTPNRKAIKELIAAWPNVVDLVRHRSLWKK